MHTIELSRIDLNLLLVLGVLLDESSVTRAAARLGRTQSAVSHALERLRETLEDPLFVRAGQRLSATPRAEELRPHVQRALAALVEVWQPAVFDASRQERTFTVSASDYLQAVVIPGLIRRLRAEAPGVDLVVLGPVQRVEERAARGEVDFFLGVQVEESSQLFAEALFEDRFVCVMDAKHPALRRFDKAAYLRHPHALVAPLGRPGGHVDRALAATGEKRRVAVTLPDFLVAPLAIAGTDLVMTLPERLSRQMLAQGAQLCVREVPVKLPKIVGQLVWHERLSRDPAARWFRALARQVARDIGRRQGPGKG